MGKGHPLDRRATSQGCALDHVMPRGECMPAFLVCCPPQALRLQDGPGCATPAVGDPCRTRTCVRCVRGSRPTAGRTGHFCCAEGGGFDPQCLSALADLRNRMPAAPATSSISACLAGPIRLERTLPSEGSSLFPHSYGGVAPEARFKLTTEASRASVLFTTPPGSDKQCECTAWRRVRDSNLPYLPD